MLSFVLTRGGMVGLGLAAASVIVMGLWMHRPATEKNSSALLLATAKHRETIPPLDRIVSLSTEGMPFKDALASICRGAHVELLFDDEGFKRAGQRVDLPVTVKFKDAPFDQAVARILNSLRRQRIDFVYREMRGEKLFVSSDAARTARIQRALPDWLKPLHNHGLLATVDDEGNVISIIVGEKADDDFLARLKTLPKLRDLNLDGTKLTRDGLARLTELPALEKLGLGGVPGDEALRIVSRFKTIRELTMSGVTDNGVRALESMPQLTALSLSDNRFTDAGMKSLAGLTNLQKLNLGNMEITDEGLKRLSRMTKLEELWLSGCLRITGKHIAFPRLKILELSGKRVDDSALDGIVQCRDLRYLSLSFTRVSDKGLRRIATLKELRQLSLDSTVITDAGIAHLKALPHVNNVRLRASRLGNKSLKHLSEIKTLTRLDLNGFNLISLPPARLFSFESLRQLTTRLLGVQRRSSGPNFTIEGMQQLKNLPQLYTLSIDDLDLRGGFLGLRKLTQLCYLSLHFTNIRADEAEQLSAALPDIRIHVGGGGEIVVYPRDKPVDRALSTPSR